MIRRRGPLVPALILALALAFAIAFVVLSTRRRARPTPASGLATIEFLDVGQGDSILIRSPEGKTALVDAGPSPRGVAGLVRERGIAALDLVVVSHHHNDHYGGMAEVVRDFRPRVFLDADSPHATARYVALLQRVKDQGITAIRAGPTARVIELGSVRLTVLPQAPVDAKEENNNSIGLRVDYGRFSALLTGDSQGRERRWWTRHVPELCADVRVLKLAHHGSRNGTDSAWLGLTRPALAVASLGRGNDFGHPHPEVVSLLASLEIPLKRTDESGTIAIRTDGRNWSLARSSEVARGPPRGAWKPDATAAVTAPGRPDPGPVDLNTATEAELRTLPGIGPKLARRIIAARPFRSVDDLARVPDVGRKRAEALRPFAGVAGP